MQKVVMLILCIQSAYLNTEISESNDGQSSMLQTNQQASSGDIESNTKIPRQLSWDLEIPEPRKATRTEVNAQNDSEDKRDLKDDDEEDHFPYVGVSYKIDNPPYEETFIVPYVVKEKKKSTGGPTKKKNHVFIKGKKSTTRRQKKQKKRMLFIKRDLNQIGQTDNRIENGQLVI